MISRSTRRIHTLRSSAAFTLPAAIEETFARESEELRWLAAVILGGEQHVEECIVDAFRLAEVGEYVFREWLRRWAQRATVRAALEKVRPEILSSAQIHARPSHDSGVPALAVAEKRALRSIAIERIQAECDPFERAALVLHGYLGFSAQDCALLLGGQRSAILPACASALSKVFKRIPLVESASEDLLAWKKS
jgi:DNA-directed RNA polymerase specialized sigma24 family protein